MSSPERIEGRRLQQAEAMLKCPAFNALTAWQVLGQECYGRDETQPSGVVVLTDDEQEDYRVRGLRDRVVGYR